MRCMLFQVTSKRLIACAVLCFGFISSCYISPNAYGVRQEPNVLLDPLELTSDERGVSPTQPSPAISGVSLMEIDVAMYADIVNGRLDKLRGRILSSSDFDVNYVHPRLGTLLNKAVCMSNTEIVKYLIDIGANVNLANPNGKRPLHSAIDILNKDMIRLLLDKGAKIDVSEKILDPLSCALVNDASEEIINLLTVGRNLSYCSHYEGLSPLHVAVIMSEESAKRWSPSRKGVRIIQLLLERGADVNMKDSKGRTPLHWSSSGIVSNLLISKGADTNIYDNEGKRPIDLAETIRSEILNQQVIMSGFIILGFE